MYAFEKLSLLFCVSLYVFGVIYSCVRPFYLARIWRKELDLLFRYSWVILESFYHTKNESLTFFVALNTYLKGINGRSFVWQRRTHFWTRANVGWSLKKLCWFWWAYSQKKKITLISNQVPFCRASD